MQGTPLTRLDQVEAKLDTLEASLTAIEATIVTEGNETQSAVAAVQTEVNDEHATTRGTISTKSDEEQAKLTSIESHFINDAFGRLRVSEPHTIFDSKLINDKQPLFFDEVVNGTATSVHNPGEASVSMSVSTNGDYVIRQTKMRFNYQPGKGQFILMTGVLGEPTANTESKIGYFNTSTAAPYTASEDGIYFGQDGTNRYVAISRSGTTNKITQANWNVDRLDGTGVSGITVDFDRNQIFSFDFEWLGVGIVRFGVVINGVFRTCHIENHANAAVSTGAYMQSPNHSVRYEVRSTGGTLTMKHICASVMSEGGVEPSGVTRAISNGLTTVTVGTALRGVLFLRLNSARPCTTLEIAKFGILNAANNTSNYRFVLIMNPTVAGTALSWTNLPNSAVDYALGAGDNDLTNGIVLDEGYTSGGQLSIVLPSNLLINPGIAINGDQDVVAIGVQMFSGSDTFVASMSVRELTCG